MNQRIVTWDAAAESYGYVRPGFQTRIWIRFVLSSRSLRTLRLFSNAGTFSSSCLTVGCMRRFQFDELAFRGDVDAILRRSRSAITTAIQAFAAKSAPLSPDKSARSRIARYGGFHPANSAILSRSCRACIDVSVYWRRLPPRESGRLAIVVASFATLSFQPATTTTGILFPLRNLNPAIPNERRLGRIIIRHCAQIFTGHARIAGLRDHHVKIFLAPPVSFASSPAPPNAQKRGIKTCWCAVAFSAVVEGRNSLRCGRQGKA